MGLLGKFTIVFMLLSSNFVIAQKDSVIAKNTIFVEVLGSGRIGSLNYDRCIYINKIKLSFRIGFLYYPMQNKQQPFAISTPFEMNVLKGQKNHIEFGLGFTYIDGLRSNNRRVAIINTNNFIYKEEYSKALYFIIKPIGYRLQKNTGGMFLKLSGLVYCKTVEFNSNYLKSENEAIVEPFIGFSLGYTFKNRVL
jgi:hypothetical protein